MAEKYAIKQYDLEPAFEVQLSDGSTPISLLNAVGVKFIMRNRAGLKVAAAMTVADQVERPGVVTYRWNLGDTDTAGTFQAEIQVTWPGARAQTFPGDSYMAISIVKDLDRAGAA